MKVVRTVFNGGHEETYGNATRLVPTQLGGDSALDADAGLPFQKGDASGLGVFSGAPRVHHGRLQCAGPVAWVPAQCVWVRAPLDR